MEMHAATAIQNLVECVLPRFSDNSVGLYVPLDVRLSKFGKNGRETKHCLDIHLLFHRPANYTKVFWYHEIDSFKHPNQIPEDAWKMECDHDSCWTTDGLSTPLHRVWQDLQGKFSKGTDLSKLSSFVHFGMTGCHLRQVLLVKSGIEDDYTRRYNLVLGHQIEYTPVKLFDK